MTRRAVFCPRYTERVAERSRGFQRTIASDAPDFDSAPSSAPALDLYKASASGCPNKDLSKVTAWDYRDGEVYLYQPGGTVAARLRQGGGALDGALSKSGASLAMVR